MRRMFCHMWAALLFFTRLPLWRLKEVPSESFKHIVPYWPVAGWLTGGVMAAVLWIAARCFPMEVAWALALVARLLLTGALHEDGLADFADGMGGGHTRERTLAIMKDSHIGSYGVIALLFYFLLAWQMHRLPLPLLCGVAWAGDVWCKCIGAQIVNLLPYARREEESKAHVVYGRMTPSEFVVSWAVGVAAPLLWLPSVLLPALLVPPVVFLWLVGRMRRRLQGYTGDCCGALFLFCELSFYLAVLACFRWSAVP